MKIRLGIVFLLCAIVTHPVAHAQNDRDAIVAASDDATITIGSTSERDFPQITLDFIVKAKNGETILDAKQADFRVTESDKTVEITKFSSPISREYRPTTVVLVLDRSGSMKKENRIGGLKKAVRSFLENQPQGSRVAVIAFGSEVELICPFTSDTQKIQDAVDELRADGNTRYYDAVTLAITLLSEETGRRAVLAMTDGEDNISLTASLETTIRKAQREGLPVHTLGLGPEDEIQTEALRFLAEQTRGQSFTAKQADGLRSIFEEIAKGLSQSYSLTYRSDRALQDGTLRPIKIFYRKSAIAGETQVYIPGMVVPAAGWSWLFLVLIAGLSGLAAAPGLLRRRVQS